MERGAREDETVAFDFKTAYISSKLCIPILSLMPFIYNDHIVANVRQVHGFGGDHSIGSYENSAIPSELLHLGLSLVLVGVELHDVGVSTPFAELLLPVGLHGCWHDYEHFFNHFGIEETFEESGNLDSFAEAHVVSEDATLAAVPEVVEPLDTELLVIEEV